MKLFLLATLLSIYLTISAQSVNGSGNYKLPESLNVSEGSSAEFSCGSYVSDLEIIWFHSVQTTQVTEHLPDGGSITKLQLIALAVYNQSEFSCYIINTTSGDQVDFRQATLLIQGPLASVGDLHSTINDTNCINTLHWTPPYSLHGVPILGYNVSIGDTNTVTVNDTSYQFIPSLLNGTHQIQVSPINGAGEGNTSSITISNLIIIDLMDYYWNGSELSIIINVQGICSFTSIEMISFNICHSMTNCSLTSLYTNDSSVSYNSTSLNTQLSVKLTLPDESILTFTLHHVTGQLLILHNVNIINTATSDTTVLPSLSTTNSYDIISISHYDYVTSFMETINITSSITMTSSPIVTLQENYSTILASVSGVFSALLILIIVIIVTILVTTISIYYHNKTTKASINNNNHQPASLTEPMYVNQFVALGSDNPPTTGPEIHVEMKYCPAYDTIDRLRYNRY
jgi:hypothetical protein